MRCILSFMFCFISLAASAQSDLLFLMDATSGRIGDYSEITYTITNISSNDVNNISIDHPDAIVPNFNLSPSTLPPGATITATGRIAISGENLNSIRARVTLATATATVNGTTITEISDGIDLQGNRVSDGPSSYFFIEPTDYGIIYIDVDADGNYDPNVDTPIPGAVINVADNRGNTFSFTTNEAGWWQLSDTNSQMIAGEQHRAVIDLTSFPGTATNYQLTEGEIPFFFIITLADVFPQAHGFVDGNNNFGIMRVTAFIDANNNGTRDTGEVDMPYSNFEFVENNDPATSTTINNGTGLPVLKSDLDPGVQLNDVNATLSQFDNLFTITTPNYDDILTAAGTTTEVAFAVTEVASSNRDAAIFLINNRSPNPGFNSSITALIKNTLNGTAAGTLVLDNDPSASVINIIDENGDDLIVNGTAVPTSSGFTIPYNISSFDQSRLKIIMSTPVTGVQMGDTFTHTATINPTSLDNDSTNNSTTLDVEVVASYDPNDVTEIRGASIPINTFSNTDYLEYTIRFQNLGTANAQFVRVLSTLNNRLDHSTFEMIATSHDYIYEKDGADLDFFFDNIQLPPESVDEDGSNGFIVFKIKPLPGYSVGDMIAASADIFFDYNPAVITETWTTEFTATASIDDVSVGKAYPIPLVGNTLFLDKIDTGKARLFAIDGREVWKGNVTNGALDLSEIGTGLYILKIVSGTDQIVIKLSRK